MFLMFHFNVLDISFCMHRIPNLGFNSMLLFFIETHTYTNSPLEPIIAGMPEKNHMIVTVVAITLVTTGILISIYNFRNKGLLFMNNVVLLMLFVSSL